MRRDAGGGSDSRRVRERQWRRVGGWTSQQTFPLGLLVVSLLTGVPLVVSFLGGAGPLTPFLLYLAGTAVWANFLWRLVRAGVFTSEWGVRVRWFHRTRFYAWDEIDTVRAEPARRARTRSAIWLGLRTGQLVETPVQSGRGGLPTFGTVLDSMRFDVALADLRSGLPLHRGPQ